MERKSGIQVITAIVTAALLLYNVEFASCDRDQISCFYCAPDSSNNLCATVDKVTQQIECLSGRCLVLGARLKATGKVARFFTCDTHNIIDWGFQILQYPADRVDDKNCGWLEGKDDEAITMLREYGLQGDMQKLLQGTLPTSGADVSAVADKLEVCTCEGKLCNSPDAQLKWTLIPADGQNLQPRRSDFDQKNDFNGKERFSPKLTPRVGFEEKDRDRMDRYIHDNNERGGAKTSHMDNQKAYDGHSNHGRQHAERLMEGRAGNSPRQDDGWWYWFVIVLSILAVLGALYLLYRVASSPTHAERDHEQTMPLRHRT